MRLGVSILLSGWLLAQPVQADTGTKQTETPLNSFKAVYTTAFDLGVSLNGEAIRELKPLENGDWSFTSEASALMAGISEKTRFTYLPSEHIKPISYRYHRKILGKSRKASIDFDWANNRVTTIVKDQPWKMSIPEATQDKLSYQLQMRLDLMAGKTEMTYAVADGGKLKEYRFTVTGEETIETPFGTFNAVRVMRDRGANAERETLIWFAPELDYLIVRLEQTETDGKTYGLLLKNLETP